MAARRLSQPKPDGSDEIPTPVPWRHSRKPSIGSVQILQTQTPTQRLTSILFQYLLVVLLIGYLMLPSHMVERLAEHANLKTFHDAGRAVIASVMGFKSLIATGRESGVGIVAACKNRHETLEKVLPTWLAVKGVEEIVIIDWSSDPPLQPIVNPSQDPRLKLFRVHDEESWVLSRAYNLGLNLSTRPYVIRTDCDYSLHEDLLEAHNLNETDRSFYSGNWLLAQDENEVHLNGAMVLKRDIFWSVGGYDERIQTYGWDDEDLYTRLVASNFSKLNVSYDHVTHISHGDMSRGQSGVKFVQVQIDLNQLLLEKLPQWSPVLLDGENSSRYEVITEDRNGYCELKAVNIPAALKQRVGTEEYGTCWDIALGRRLADDFQIPWDVIAALESKDKETLLRSLIGSQNELDRIMQDNRNSSKTERPLPSHARILLIHAQHGLGNRLRALGSGLAFARNSLRTPVLIWNSDAHIAANFDDLFERTSFVVLKTFAPKWPFTDLQKYDEAWNHFLFYNYMEMEEGARKGELIENDVDKHIYYKGAYIMEAPQFSWWEVDNEELRKLKPVTMVEQHLRKLEKKGLSKAIGIHIRNRTLAQDIKNVDFNQEYGETAAQSMEHWRLKSSYKTFVAEAARIIEEEDKDATFYVATDTKEVIEVMREKFPGKILSTPRQCDDRNSKCVQYAVIDMYALSRTKRLLGSNWSSYTELAERLGGLKARLAGEHFGTEPVGQMEGPDEDGRTDQGGANIVNTAREAEAPVGEVLTDNQEASPLEVSNEGEFESQAAEASVLPEAGQTSVDVASILGRALEPATEALAETSLQELEADENDRRMDMGRE